MCVSSLILDSEVSIYFRLFDTLRVKYDRCSLRRCFYLPQNIDHEGTLHRLRGFWGTALAFRNLYFATHPPFGANYVRLRLPDIPPCFHRALASARKACAFEINSIVCSRQCVTQVGGIVRNYSFNSCCLESPRDVYVVQMDYRIVVIQSFQDR